MNIKSIYSAGIALGGAGTAWAIRKAIDLPSFCAPIKVIYDNCYTETLRKLGGGYDLFDFASWTKISHFSEARRICADKDTYDACLRSGVSYIATAFLCSAVAISAIVKLVRAHHARG
jgi:hypothetical protein